MTTGIVYDDIYLKHEIGTHIESHERLIAINEYLKEMGVLEDPNFKLIQPRKATLEQIEYIHTKSLINDVKDICERAKQAGRFDVGQTW